MSDLILRVLEDRLSGGVEPVYLPRLSRALFVAEGAVAVETATSYSHHENGSAWVGDAEAALFAGRNGARLLRWELVLATSKDDGKLRAAPSCTSGWKLSAEVDLPIEFGWLMRCDTVGFPTGGIAYTHVHQGPGIRVCLEGEIRIETEGAPQRYRPGDAWFESGLMPVLAPTSEDAETSFVRCFVLPRGCKGRSSIRYVRPEDATKPKTQRYRILAERFIELPTS